MYALVAAKKDATNRGEVLGDIKPENVFISRDEKVKVGCLRSFPEQLNNYQKLTSENTPTYNVMLAPEDLDFAR